MPSVPLFRVRPDNHFHTETGPNPTIETLEAELLERTESGVGGCGSLNTTFDYGGDDGAVGS